MQRRERILLVAASGLAVVILLALRASVQTPDSLAYMVSARTGREMFHPHHLLYVPIVRLVLEAGRGLGLGVDAVLAAQFHNTVAGVLCSAFGYLIVRRWAGSAVGALVTALALLFSRGFWVYSTQADVYVPATAWLAGVTLLLPRPGEDPAGWRIPGILTLVAMSTLYHQTNVLICVPIAYWYASLRSPRAWRALAVILLGAGALVVAAYLLAFLRTDASLAMAEFGSRTNGTFLERFLRFCLAYQHHPNPDWGTFRNVSVQGIGRLVHSQVWNVSYFPDAFKYVATAAFALLLGGLTLWHALQLRRGDRLVRERVYLLAWIATYGSFFLWWLPSEREFFITPLFPLVLLAAIALDDVARAWPSRAVSLNRASVVALAGLLAGNLFGAILPNHLDRGSAFAEAADVAALSPSCSVFNAQPINQNLRYYFGNEDVYEIDLPLLHAMAGDPIPERFHLATKKCALIPAAYLRPDSMFFDRTGYDHPAGWLTFIRWALDARPKEDGGGWEYREHDVVLDAAGRKYLRLGAGRAEASSLANLFEKVDAEFSDAPDREVGPLVTWWAKTGR